MCKDLRFVPRYSHMLIIAKMWPMPGSSPGLGPSTCPGDRSSFSSTLAMWISTCGSGTNHDFVCCGSVCEYLAMHRTFVFHHMTGFIFQHVYWRICEFLLVISILNAILFDIKSCVDLQPCIRAQAIHPARNPILGSVYLVISILNAILFPIKTCLDLRPFLRAQAFHGSWNHILGSVYLQMGGILFFV